MERMHSAREKMIADGVPRNAAIADSQVGWEIGNFKLTPEEVEAERKLRDDPLWFPEYWSPEIERGLIIRTRRDAMETKLNVADLLRRIDKLEKSPAAVPQPIYFMLIMIFFTTVGLPLLHVFGLYNP